MSRTNLIMYFIILFLLGMVTAALLSGCEEGQSPKVNKQIYYNFGNADIKVVEIDSCEYILNQSGESSWCTHKGNCKYCEARRKRNVQNSTK